MPRKKATPRVREETAPYAAESSAADARLSFRVDGESKELIELAAAHCGQTVSSYAISTLVRDARRVVQEHHTTVLSARDWEMFTELLDNPPAPNEALKRAARSYREMVVSRTEP